MAETIGWIVVGLWLSSLVGVVDFTVDVRPHVENEKVTCLRVKSD